MAYVIPIYAAWSDNILRDATITGTTPMTSYSRDKFISGNAAARVRYSASSITIVFTLSGSRLGEVLVIPMHNLTPGSTTVLNLSNAAGLNQNIPVPAKFVDGFPPTIAYDFSALSNKTSDVWTITVTSNAANVIFGAAIAIYPKKTFASVTDHSTILWQVRDPKTRNITEATNEYASVYVQDYGTYSRQKVFTAVGQQSGINTLRDWFDGNLGRLRPGLFWMDPSDTTGAIYGRMQKTFDPQPFTHNRKKLDVTFDEWPKGEVL